MKDKTAHRIYQNEFYNYYSDENDYPKRIRKPVGILLLIVLVGIFLIAFNFLK